MRALRVVGQVDDLQRLLHAGGTRSLRGDAEDPVKGMTFFQPVSPSLADICCGTGVLRRKFAT